MFNSELIFRNPLEPIGYDETSTILSNGGFGAVLARAGVGKTSLLVQLALSFLTKKRNVLHISLGEPVSKVCLWYKEVFQNLAGPFDEKQVNSTWEAIMPYRFIMTFKAESFSVPILKERLTDLIEQNIFNPQMIIIDGFPFNESMREAFAKLKNFAKKHSICVWFAVKTHRHEELERDGLPAPLNNIDDFFEVVVELQPMGKEIHVKPLKGGLTVSDKPILFMDPSTMLVQH